LIWKNEGKLSERSEFLPLAKLIHRSEGTLQGDLAGRPSFAFFAWASKKRRAASGDATLVRNTK